MANRFHHIFLKRLFKSFCLPVIAALSSPLCFASSLKIDTEFFELGANVGVISVQHFSSENTLGLNTSFRATENFFLQANILKAETAISSAEEYFGGGSYSDKRDYRHFNVLLGYRLFQGEIFRGKYSGLSSLYAKGGVGQTQYLNEFNFTYVFGFGYQLALGRHYSLTFDFTQHQYDTVVIDPNKATVRNSHLALGLNWLF